MDIEARILRDGVDLLCFEALDDVGFAIEQRERAGRGVADEVIFDAGNLRRAHEEVRIGGKDGGVAFCSTYLKGPVPFMRAESCALFATSLADMIGRNEER